MKRVVIRLNPPFMFLVMVGFTIWNCVEGERGWAMTLVASIGTVALLMVLGLFSALFRQTRVVDAFFAGLWVAIFMPIWDWLSRIYEYPASLYLGLMFGAGFGLFRYFFTGRRSARPPS